MKKIALSFLALLYCTITFALDASVSFATFKGTTQNYVEVYLYVVGNTVEYKMLDSTRFQSNVEVVILFKQGENIVKFDKYALNSPISPSAISFIDIKRYALKDGDYTIEVSINDLNRTENAKSFNAPLKIEYEGDGLMQSDIELLTGFKRDSTQNPFVKNGYYLDPLSFNFYDKNASKLIFYNEIYNTDKSLKEDFVIRYAVQEVKGNGQSKDLLVGHKRRSPKSVNALLLQLDISKLASGNYNLVVEVRNRGKELLSQKKVFFQRSNPYLNIDDAIVAEIDIKEEFVASFTDEEILYSLKAISPVISELEVDGLNTLIKGKDVEKQRRFLLTYWLRQDPNKPEDAYQEFMKVARAVDSKYRNGFGLGFETDRGYTYMKYGQPSDIVSSETEPTAPPYEIWVYYDFPYTNQSNVKFIFYNPTLAHNGHEMLHSTARGEIYNRNWEQELYRSAPSSGNLRNGGETNGNFNSNARSFFDDF